MLSKNYLDSLSKVVNSFNILRTELQSEDSDSKELFLFEQSSLYHLRQLILQVQALERESHSRNERSLKRIIRNGESGSVTTSRSLLYLLVKGRNE